MFDWMHNGEGFSVFLLQPLSDPYNHLARQRMERFAGFYMGSDPQAHNYDAARRVIRSRFNGSRGPMMRKATGLDWAGDSLEIEGRFNPAMVSRLTELMLGGLPTERMGFPLHCRVRYFDPKRRRAGMPEDVGALVENMGADEMTLTLVNTDQLKSRTVVVQGGAYGEHQFVSVSHNGVKSSIDGDNFTVRLGPGCGSRLQRRMTRYANRPTCVFPWDR